MPSDYLTDLINHKQRVAGHMQTIAGELFRRAATHDSSKFSPEEYEAYEAAYPHLQQYAYGSSELRAELRKIKPAIEHHYAENDHHPEHFWPGDISSMHLAQIVEMVCDWLAASERRGNDTSEGLNINRRRYGVDEQLFAIISNTVALLEKESSMGSD